MLVIVEGPDNAGKSTLAKTLSERLGFVTVHPGGKPYDYREAQLCCVVQDSRFRLAADATQQSIIHDRITCISDYAYNDRYRFLYMNFRNKLCDKIREGLPIVLIYCRPPFEIIQDFGRQGDGIKPHKDAAAVKFARQNIQIITERYDKLMSKLPHIRYDYTVDKQLPIIDKV